jgi:hypothetical protein
MSEAHGDEDIVDTTNYEEQALEEVLECILNFGQWPQPRRVGALFSSGGNGPKQFDLYDFLAERSGLIEFSELLEFFCLALNDHSRIGVFEDSRSRWEGKITKALTEHLAGHPIVIGQAQKLKTEAQVSA